MRYLLLGALVTATLAACNPDFAQSPTGGAGGLTQAEAPPLSPDAPDYAVVAQGARVPFGQVARLCGVPERSLGRVSARAGGFKLIDPDPRSTAQRTLYIGGFDDGCVRQVSGALALFGDFGTHEQLRYLLSAKIDPYSATDNAYEDLKARVCRVGRLKPCRDRSFGRNGTFLSLQPYFEGSTVYETLLLYDGALVAADLH